LATPNDPSEHAGTLPRAELNPLLNPILADNMGRWAEVYFTSPPEKREEAVVELIRELESQNEEHDAAQPSTDLAALRIAEPKMPIFDLEGPSDSLDSLRQCDACGHENPATHQFCGMCGAQLVPTHEDSRVESAPNASDSSAEVSEEAQSSPPDAAEENYAVAEHPRRDPYDLSLFQSFREKGDDETEYEQPPSARYRYYIVVVLAALILGLGYMAWRSALSNQSAQDRAPLAPPSTDTTPSPARPEAAPPAASNVPPTASAEPKTAEPAHKNNPTEPPTAKSTEKPELPTAPAIATKTAPKTASATTPDVAETARGNGWEELAMAERYLSGGTGQARDPAEAAKWLWKAMAKHNGPASLALADLYLKGDGVSKNCDQARVLLYSAARRGMGGAGERLRNLQAFGCR